MSLYGQEHIKASYHPANMISQDHKIKGPCNLMNGSPTWKVPTLPSLVAIGIVVVDMFLVAEEEDFRYSRFNLPFLLISKGHGLKEHNIS